jgi:ATP-dependent RNA helicase DeaD
VGLAQTGTGKTAAFAVPALSKVAELADVNGRADHPQVLVLAPTRELALQVAEAFSSYAKYLDDLTILPIYGGSPYGPQLSALRRGAQVVVGTPGRVIDHLDRGSLDLSQLSYLVLDEADEMLRMGFAEEVDHILEATPAEKQVALFSATMPRQIRRIADQYLNDPEQVAVDQASTPGENIRQRYIQVMHSYKLDVMARILETEEHDGVIAFVRTKVASEEVATKLKARGFRAVAIHGDINQVQRERTVDQLRSGNVDILVATDVAARGLDVERISHVFNYDIPHDTESYVHRIGRTGRAGRQGDAVLFITPRERYLLKHIERATGGAVVEAPIPGVEAVNNSRLGRLATKIEKTLTSSDLAPYRELITSYLAEHEVDAVEVAAALAHLAQGGRPLLTEEIPTIPSKKQREERGAKNKRSRDEFGSRGPSKPVAPGNATYRISVGHRQRVLPGSIVGALANEGGLTSNDIGSIDIRSDHSLVELPENLPADALAKLQDTRIGGRPIHLEKDTGRRPNRERFSDDDGRDDRRNSHRGGYQGGGNRGRNDRFQDRGGKRDFHKGNKGNSKPWERDGSTQGNRRDDRWGGRDDRRDDRRNDRRGRDEDRSGGYRGRSDRGEDRGWNKRDDGGRKGGFNPRHDGDFRGERKPRKPRHR